MTKIIFILTLGCGLAPRQANTLAVDVCQRAISCKVISDKELKSCIRCSTDFAEQNESLIDTIGYDNFCAAIKKLSCKDINDDAKSFGIFECMNHK